MSKTYFDTLFETVQSINHENIIGDKLMLIDLYIKVIKTNVISSGLCNMINPAVTNLSDNAKNFMLIPRQVFPQECYLTNGKKKEIINKDLHALEDVFTDGEFWYHSNNQNSAEALFDLRCALLFTLVKLKKYISGELKEFTDPYISFDDNLSIKIDCNHYEISHELLKNQRDTLFSNPNSRLITKRDIKKLYKHNNKLIFSMNKPKKS
jgi:hypothetical protein